MAEQKKYYWFKMKSGWFSNKVIKKLRSIAGGDTYTVIYLKMILKSLENGGYLYFEGVESSFAEEVALDIDEDDENVTVTINYLLSKELLQEDDNGYLLTEVPLSILSECSSAERVRKHRENTKKALHCNNDVTEMKQLVTNCNTEIEIEKELKLELEQRDKVRVRDKTIGANKSCNKSKTVYFTEDEELNNAFLDFMAMRKKIKKPLSTDRAINLAINDIRKFSTGVNGIIDIEKAIAIIDQSIKGSWTGIYDLKSDGIKQQSLKTANNQIDWDNV